MNIVIVMSYDDKRALRMFFLKRMKIESFVLEIVCGETQPERENIFLNNLSDFLSNQTIN